MNFFKMKKAEIELKFMVYTYLLGIIKNQKDVVELIAALYHELKGIPADELKDKFIVSISKIIHAQTQGNGNDQ